MIMHRSRKLLIGGIVAVAFSLGAGSAVASSHWHLVSKGAHWHRSKGPVVLGPWVRGPWDYNLDYYGGGEYAGSPFVGWGSIDNPFYPWGYTAPYVRAGRVCVANQWATNGVGVLVRYQKVRPLFYCEPY